MSRYEKHELNIFPDMNSGDYVILEKSLESEGFLKDFPIILYQGKILDGWQRYQICDKKNIEPVFKQFKGDDIKAHELVMTTNKRRNLTPSQWACLAVENESIKSHLRQLAREREIEGGGDRKSKEYKKIGYKKNFIPDSPKHENTTVSKLARQFNTNPTYVQAAGRLKEEDKKQFERVKSGRENLSKFINKNKKSRPRNFYHSVNSRLTDALDSIEFIVQGDHDPVTKHDMPHIEAIYYNLHRAVHLAARFGVNVENSYKVMIDHSKLDKGKIPKHLLYVEDADVIGD